MELGVLWFAGISGELNHTHPYDTAWEGPRHTGLSQGFSELINRETLTSIEDLSLVESPNYCLLPVTFVDLHQACPGGVVASFSAHPEHIAVHVWALAHGALKAGSRNAERGGRGQLELSALEREASVQTVCSTYLSNITAKCPSEYLLHREVNYDPDRLTVDDN